MQSIDSSVLPPISFRVVEEKTGIKKAPHIKLIEGFAQLINKICRVAWNILSVVIFPIGLIRFAVQIIAPLLVLPAARKFDLDEKTRELQELPEDQATKRAQLEQAINMIRQLHAKRSQFLESHEAEQITIQTADGVELDTFKILNEASDKWIVDFRPNASCYEEALDELKNISEKTGANVYTGNYRGVMRSKGAIRSTHDMELDGAAMVEKLLSEGVLQENILIHGRSIGGGVGAAVASRYPKVHHCNDRSFASLSHVIKDWLPLGGLLAKIAWLAGWRFDSVENFKKIQGHRLVIFSRTDGVIPFQASLYKVLTDRGIKTNTLGLSVTIRDGEAGFIRQWKEAFPNTSVEEAEKRAKVQYHKRVGQISHSCSLQEIEDIFNTYVGFVKHALHLPN